MAVCSREKVVATAMVSILLLISLMAVGKSFAFTENYQHFVT